MNHSPSKEFSSENLRTNCSSRGGTPSISQEAKSLTSSQLMWMPLVPGPCFENYCAILSWAGFLATPCKMGLKCPPLQLCFMSPPLKLGVFVLVTGTWQNSWIPLPPPPASSPRQASHHTSPICYPFLSLSLQIRDGGSCGNMEGTLLAASGISAILHHHHHPRTPLLLSPGTTLTC